MISTLIYSGLRFGVVAYFRAWKFELRLGSYAPKRHFILQILSKKGKTAPQAVKRPQITKLSTDNRCFIVRE